jgi:hypothetical protein
MPWDWDLDTQVSSSTLTWLGDNLNMTFHNYTGTGADGIEVHREFLLDVNPNSADRLRGDGQNVIDARWIDTRNGLFIDITGLAETNPSMQPGIWSCKNFHRYRTRDIYPLRETEFEGVPALIPYSFDRILTEEYSARALTKTEHEGYVFPNPSRPTSILTSFFSHQWIPTQKEWVKKEGNSQEVLIGLKGAHVPRSLDGEEKPRAGLGNLRKIF